jgi:hypothetical protein
LPKRLPAKYDPFPKSGRIKQYEPFIRKYVGKISRHYPQPHHDDFLFEAVRLAWEAEKHFKPDLGHDFSTLLAGHLKGLHRFAKREIGDHSWSGQEARELPRFGSILADRIFTLWDRASSDIRYLAQHDTDPMVQIARMRAVFDHHERRLDESEQEAESRSRGDFGSVFLKAKPRFWRGLRARVAGKIAARFKRNDND